MGKSVKRGPWIMGVLALLGSLAPMAEARAGGGVVRGVVGTASDARPAAPAVAAVPPRVVLQRTWLGTLHGRFELTITFSEAVTGFVLSDIQVVNASAASALSGTGASYTVTMTTTANFEGIVTVTVPANVAVNAGGEGNVQQILTFDADTRSPTALKADVDGRDLVVTFSENLNETVVPSVNRFGVEVTRAGVTTRVDVSNVEIDRDDVELTLASRVRFGDVVALTYGDTGPNALRDLVGNQAAAFNQLSVRNTTDQTVVTVPGAPQDLIADPEGSTVIVLNWQPPASDGGDSVQGYVIEVSADGGTTWATLVRDTRSTVTRYRHQGLTAGLTRHYRVSAINANGTGATSNVARATTAEAYPGPPRALTARALGTSSIRLDWTAPRPGGAGAITGYRIEVSESASGRWTILEEDTRTRQTQFTHTGLSPGMQRYYRVFALNRAGRSDPSNVANATTDATVPGAPVGFRVVPSGIGGARELLLTWSRPVSDGGSRITGYRIEMSPTGVGGWTVVLARTDGAVTSYTHTGLLPGTTRFYRVAAVNAQGTGAYTRATQGTTRATAPAAPRNVRATPTGPSAVTVSWLEPFDNGGRPVTGYRIRFRSSLSAWVVIEANTGSAAKTYRHGGLSPNTTYFYQVAAVNDAGIGPWSGEASTRTTADVPGRPRSLAARASGTNAIVLTWSPPGNDGGARVTGYRLEVSSDAGSTWRLLRSNTGTTATSLTDGNLQPATTRHYRVFAINQRGIGPASNIASATTAATVPGAPRRVTASAEGTARIKLAWQAPARDGGADVAGYRIEARDDGGAWEGLVANTRSVSTSYVETGLAPATTRHYRVLAINRVGAGPASAVATATTDATVPDPPTGLVATASSPTQIDLTWTAPAYDGGAAIQGYRVEASESGTTWVAVAGNTGSTATSYAHTGLAPGSRRSYRISAINRAGAGTPSAVASAMTDDPVQRAGRLNTVVLPHVVAAMTSSSISAIGDRIDAVATGVGASRRLRAGGMEPLEAGALPTRGTGLARGLDGTPQSLAHFLGGTSFQLPLGAAAPQEAPRRRLTMWGGGDYHDLGQPAGSNLEWSGSLTSGHVGADAPVADRVLAGVAASHSRGAFDFTDKTGAGSVAGTYRTIMTSVNPYLAWLPDDFGTSLWATGGLGWGDVQIDDARAGMRTAPARLVAGGIGAAHQLASYGMAGVRLRAEGWAGRWRIDGSSETVDSVTLNLQRARLLLEWTQGFRMADRNEISFQLEGGVRYDNGDGANGAGMEVGGGIRYRNLAAGLTMEGRGRFLLSDLDGYEEWGVGGRIELQPGAADEGLSIRLMPSYGQAAGGVDQLWERGVAGAGAVREPVPAARARLDGEFGWGLPGHRGTPFGGVYLDGGGALVVRGGVRYDVAPGVGVRVEATRQDGVHPTRHALGLRGSVRLR